MVVSRRFFIIGSLAWPILGSNPSWAGPAGSLCVMTRPSLAGQSGVFPASQAAEKDADDVFEALGLGQRDLPVFATYEIANAAAFPNLAGRGPAIAYNPDFMTRLYQINSWAPVSVIAHEVGHHYARDRANPSSHRRELAADEVSGCAMAWMGASLEQATAAMTRGLPVNSGSASHPGTSKRVAAIRTAFENCGDLQDFS